MAMNFSNTSPAAPPGNVNITWQSDYATPSNISAYVPSVTATFPWGGNGADGTVTLDGTATYTSLGITVTGSSGSYTYTLTRDLYPSSLTLNTGITLITGWYRIFCPGTVTVNGHLNNDGSVGASSIGRNGGTGGFNGPFAAPTYAPLPDIMHAGVQAPNGANGGSGSTGSGASGSSSNSGQQESSIGQYYTHLGSVTYPTPSGAAGGAGGNSGANTGGAGGTSGGGISTAASGGGTPKPQSYPYEPDTAINFHVFVVSGSVLYIWPYTVNLSGGSAAGGGAGAGDGTHTGGYGGGGGGNGGSGEPLVMAAASIIVGAAGVISSNGGNGGVGGTGGTPGGSAAYGGGGGGGTGGPAGAVLLVYNTLVNNGIISATGGTGGAGGAGGGASGGLGGAGGAGGTNAFPTPSNGAAGGSASGIYGHGGPGGTGGEGGFIALIAV